MITRAERLAGGLVGLLVGDALGVPYEFHDAEFIPPLAQIDFTPPGGYPRSHARIPPGTWSDDGAQALCLLKSLLHCQGLDPADLGNRIVNWSRHGYLAVDSEVFDIGIQTSRALNKLEAGTPALEAGPRGERDNGNGSLMRVLPLALWHRGTDAEFVRDAHLQSQITHGHERSLACCALYCLWARRLLEETPDAWNDAVTTLRGLYAQQGALSEALEQHLLADAVPRGSGYVVDCLRSARSCVERGESYEEVVKLAVRFGDDTDTTACVAGGIAGIVYGVEAIPQRWRDGLRGQELFRPLLEQLLKERA